jgi:hypothetical protein
VALAAVVAAKLLDLMTQPANVVAVKTQGRH